MNDWHILLHVIMRSVTQNHLKEFNHKEGFWALVALTVPDWQALRAELRAIAT